MTGATGMSTPDSTKGAAAVDTRRVVRSRQSTHFRALVGQQPRQLNRSQPGQVRSGAPRDPGRFEAGTSNFVPHCSQNRTSERRTVACSAVVICERTVAPASPPPSRRDARRRMCGAGEARGPSSPPWIRDVAEITKVRPRPSAGPEPERRGDCRGQTDPYRPAAARGSRDDNPGDLYSRQGDVIKLAPR